MHSYVKQGHRAQISANCILSETSVQLECESFFNVPLALSIKLVLAVADDEF